MRACSRFRPDSELARSITPTAGRSRLSPLLAEAVAVALRAAELTGGDVDPTVGEAIVAAGYDRDFTLVPADGPALNLVVRAVPGWHQVRLDLGSRTLTMPPGIRLDLGATAKAWTADRAAARVAATLGTGVLVGLGGDISVAGPAPDGGWRIRVQDVTGRPEEDPVRARHRRRDHRRRPRDLEHHRPAVAPRRQRAAPHPGPSHRPASGPGLAHGFGDRRDLRGRQHGQHRRHRPRRRRLPAGWRGRAAARRSTSAAGW